MIEPVPVVVLPDEERVPVAVLPEDERVPVAVGMRFLAVVTALPTVRTAAPGSPQELREITSAVRAVHWMKRFMWRKNDNHGRRVKLLVKSRRTFFIMVGEAVPPCGCSPGARRPPPGAA